MTSLVCLTNTDPKWQSLFIVKKQCDSLQVCLWIQCILWVALVFSFLCWCHLIEERYFSINYITKLEYSYVVQVFGSWQCLVSLIGARVLVHAYFSTDYLSATKISTALWVARTPGKSLRVRMNFRFWRDVLPAERSTYEPLSLYIWKRLRSGFWRW